MADAIEPGVRRRRCNSGQTGRSKEEKAMQEIVLANILGDGQAMLFLDNNRTVQLGGA